MDDYKLANGIIIKNQKGEVLFLKRIKNGLWTMPGGKVNKGEDFLESARRELKEETGLKNIELEFYMDTKSLANGINWQEKIYIGNIENENIIKNNEPHIFSEMKFINIYNEINLKEFENYEYPIIEKLRKE